MEDMYSIHQGVVVAGDDLTDLLKAQIAGHPRYPSLLAAYIDCRKVGAPPGAAALLEEIAGGYAIVGGSHDPELDEFMESYCGLLVKYKEELSRPLEEASSFLNAVEAQLSTLCSPSPAPATISEDAAGSSSGELQQHCGGGGAEISSSCSPPGGGVRAMLLKKYSGCLGRLRSDFMKKNKKTKLPREARSALLNWWSAHYRWPYPTEEDKQRLAAATGLDTKQINNWFINQRKRHWKPSEDMRFALIDGVDSAGAGAHSSTGTTIYFDAAAGIVGRP